MNMDLLLPWVTVLLAGFSAISFFEARRKLNMDEGSRREKAKVQNDEIMCLKAKIEVLEKTQHMSDVDMAEIKTELKNMADALIRIEQKVDMIAPPTVIHKERK